MRKILTLLCFTTILFQSKAQLNQPTEIPVTITREGHVLVKCKVNGVEGTFIFDTGAGLNLMTRKFADKLPRLEKTTGFYTGHRATGEAIVSDLWITESLEVGTTKFLRETFTVIDLDFPVDGLLSLQPFRNVAVTIDYKRKVLRVESPASLTKLANKNKSVPIQLADDAGKAIDIFTYVKVNDTLTLQISLDSGAGFNVYRFNSRYMVALGVDSAKAEQKYIPSPFVPSQGNKFFFTKLSKIYSSNGLKGTTDFKATFIEGLIYEGIAGINWLGDVLTFDLANKRILCE